MKKVWGFIASLFIGFSAGLITMYKLMGDQIEINIKKIKSKRTNDQGSINIPINVQSAAESRETKRQRRKLERKKLKDG